MQTNRPVRVRFAPSPTGYLHIGNLRTALFNWLFARHNNGTFLIRVEDTDQERSKPEYTQAILSTLEWLNITPDEPLVYQSERLPLYKEIIETLISEGKAYRCYCSEQEIVDRHVARFGNDAFVRYDGHCRHRQASPDDEGKSFVVRFALPSKEALPLLSFTDSIRGELSIQHDQLDDFIFVRSDGWPTYNVVVVVDDALMKVTNVIRGEDHITNTFKQILLYKACGYKVPTFAHLPLILGPSGNPLSKRDAATSVVDYRRMGYLPDALFNYLIRLGWSHGDQEVFTRDELVEYFSFDHVGKKGAIFDIQKLQWLNGLYMRNATAQELVARIVDDVAIDIVSTVPKWDTATLRAIVDLYKSRVKTVKELADALEQLHAGPHVYDTDAVAKWITQETSALLALVIQTLEVLEDFTVEPIKGALKALAKEKGVKLVALAQPIRIALTGSDSSPGVFELLALLGKQESLRRLCACEGFLKK